MPLELVGGGEGPAAAVQGALEGPPALAAAVRQQVHLELVLLGEGERALRLGASVAGAGGPAAAPFRARGRLAGRRGRAPGRRRGRRGQREDAAVEAHEQVPAAHGDAARPGGGGRAAGALRGAASGTRAAGLGLGLRPPGGRVRGGARHLQQHHEGVAGVLVGRAGRGARYCPGLRAPRARRAVLGAPQQQQAAAPGAGAGRRGASAGPAGAAAAAAMLGSARGLGGESRRELHLGRTAPSPRRLGGSAAARPAPPRVRDAVRPAGGAKARQGARPEPGPKLRVRGAGPERRAGPAGPRDVRRSERRRSLLPAVLARGRGQTSTVPAPAPASGRRLPRWACRPPLPLPGCGTAPRSLPPPALPAPLASAVPPPSGKTELPSGQSTGFPNALFSSSPLVAPYCDGFIYPLPY